MSNFKKIKMKKILFTAIILLSGKLVVSCEAPAIIESNPIATEQTIIRNPIPTNPANMFADDGPGDNVIIILPPKKP